MKAGVQAIIQKIQKDAEEHSVERYTQIKNTIDNEIAADNKLYRDDYFKRREMLKKHNEREYARLLERLSSRFYREILTYQHNLIDEIYDMAVEKLRNASEEEFADMFKAVVRGLKGKFNLYLGELSAGKLDIAEIEKAVKGKRGLEINLSGETIPKRSGFILSDDRVEYNCLFEDLIEDRKNRQTASIIKEIFGDFEI